MEKGKQKKKSEIESSLQEIDWGKGILAETLALKGENYWVTKKLPQIYTANHATFPIRIRKITVHLVFILN